MAGTAIESFGLQKVGPEKENDSSRNLNGFVASKSFTAFPEWMTLITIASTALTPNSGATSS
jgi:hypothetical protein